MNPTAIDNMSWAIAEVYGAVTDRILINLAKYFPYIQDDQGALNQFQYQAQMLAHMGQVNSETAQIILTSLQGADEAVRQALYLAIEEALKTEEPKLQKAAKQGLINGPGFLPPELSPEKTRAFQAYYKQSCDKLNLVNTVMLESTEAAYKATVADAAAKIARTQTILNTAAGETITGVSSYNQAMRDAVRKMMDNGLTGFIDHAGHKWQPETFVAMDIRSTMYNTTREVIWERAEDFGSDLYQVSTHNGARPLCYPWQGKVISRTDNVRDVEDADANKVHVYAQSETSYGQPAGVFGVNCRHYPIVFIPGLSSIRGEPQSPEDNERTYAESQEQRKLERKLRKEKANLAALKAQGADKAAIDAQKEKCRAASAEIESFCDKTGRARRRDREYVPINATFPEEGTYNAAQFPRTQQEKIRQFFQDQAAPIQPPAPPSPPVSPAPAPAPAPTPKAAPVPAPTPAPAPVAPPVAPAPQPQAVTSDFVQKDLRDSHIRKLALQKWDHTPTQEEIVSNLGGGDYTKGSCASLALAYAGNRGGYNVLDFRGGKSQELFSYNTRRFLQETVAKTWVIRSSDEIKAANELFTHMVKDREYILCTGHHAAVIRMTDAAGLEYLELQSAVRNGFFPLNDYELEKRFDASHKRKARGKLYDAPNVLCDLETLMNTPDLLEALQYINTKADKQQKGLWGDIK